MSRLTDKDWKNPESLMWIKLGLIPMRNEGYRASLSDALRKLAHYEDLEEQGRLIELPCKLKNVIDVIFSHNEIVTLMCDGVDENGTRCYLHFWHGMAWNIPKEYLELQFVKIHGVVSDKLDTLYVEVDAKFTSEAAEAKLKEMEGAE